MKTIKVSSSQFNYQYGDQIHFPYSIAMLVSYIKSIKDLKDKFVFDKTFIFRDKLEEYAERSNDADILLCSCYVWNWEITNKLAKKVKEKNPECLIIFGGPQVPDRADNFFEKYPYVDLIVHGEGERIISNVFREYITDKDYTNVKGTETKDFKAPLEERMKNLEEIPSPYLSNLVWDLVEQVDGVKYIASWETNRGCPFQCTFCDWGSATKTKVRKNPEDRLMEEIEWFSENQIPYIDCCDANFGIFTDRDYRLAKKLKEQKLKTDYPEKIRPAWAKVSSERIIPIAKELQEAGLLRAVTLAVQSLDSRTLEVIKRKNIKFDKFSDLTQKFRDNDITTYTEIILGLPGETLKSYKKGLEELASLYPRPVVYIYNCGVFPNAPMNAPEYVKKYKIETLRSPIFLAHSSIHDRGLKEYEDIAISSASYSTEDLKNKYMYGWIIQAFHSLGLFEYVSKFYNQKYNMNFMNFYSDFIEYCENSKSFFSQEYGVVQEYIDNGYSGKGWNHYDSDLGDIYWPIEEATWIRLASDKKRFLKETKEFLLFIENKYNLETTEEQINDLIKFQAFLITTRDHQEEIKAETFLYNWKKYFIENEKVLREDKVLYCYKNLVVEPDPVLWGWKAAWWGRGSKKYKFYPEHLQNNINDLNDSETEDNNISVGAGGV